ncbi:unnamed protein product, partial [Ectocarpus sp. 12 AP-2014]
APLWPCRLAPSSSSSCSSCSSDSPDLSSSSLPAPSCDNNDNIGRRRLARRGSRSSLPLPDGLQLEPPTAPPSSSSSSSRRRGVVGSDVTRRSFVPAGVVAGCCC